MLAGNHPQISRIVANELGETSFRSDSRLTLGAGQGIIPEGVRSAFDAISLEPGALRMPQAIANPDDLRAFAAKLKQFNTTLTDQAAMLLSKLDVMSATWRDQENAKFSEEFKEHVRLLGKFVEANNQHIPYLLRKADRLDEYLQQR